MFTKKIIKKMKLQGHLADGSVANTRQSKQIVWFETTDGCCKISPIGIQPTHRRRDGSIRVYSTVPSEPKLLKVTGHDVGVAILSKHEKCNFYEGTIGDQEVNVELKRISGELRYVGYVPLPMHVAEGIIAKGYYGNGYS
jgi:hypothetical protein